MTIATVFSPLISFLALTSCVMSETAQSPVEIRLRLENVESRTSSIDVEFLLPPKGNDDYWVRRVGSDEFLIRTPFLRGGQSKFLGLIMISEHRPETYQILSVNLDQKSVGALSLADLLNAKNRNGIAVIDLKKLSQKPGSR